MSAPLCSVRRDGATLTLQLGNSLGAIEAGRLALAEFWAENALTDRVVNRLEVVFEEIVSNIVRHGFVPESAQGLTVEATAGAHSIVLRFEDDGAPFDPLAAVPPPQLTDLDSAPEGGLGIALVRRLAAHVAYAELAPSAGRDSFAPRNRFDVTIARGNDA